MRSFPFSDAELLGVRKPAQYLGGELHAVVKPPAEVDLSIALCFPDTYEVGMSHLGLQILYRILNALPGVAAERAFMPEPDMEALLRRRHVELFSLESHRPLASFEIVGFSLQYELCATNLLSMLDLAAIPRRSAARDSSHPLIIAGGPIAFHPEPLAPFIDAFLLGDAEEALEEITTVVREAKRAGASRRDLLHRLDAVQGVYVPGFYEERRDAAGRFLGVYPLETKKQIVEKRLLRTLSGAATAAPPLVPNVSIIHDRLAVELMRGCVRGCRFCQAGYLYRPQRERPPAEVLTLVHELLTATGFDELALLSLSTADYCSIAPLLSALMESCGADNRVAVSFPSTRVDALRPELLEQIQRVRRTTLTLAPEAGTQRLRDVINKGVSDDDILRAVERVFALGWRGVKLYFMLGLPTETEEDILGIVELARRIKRLPNAKNVVVSVSTFVPKPHTPFQWAAQLGRAEILRRQELLREALRRGRIEFRYHDAASTLLEGVLARGGRELAPVIERACDLGCRLDAWESELDEEKWAEAFSACGIDPEEYLRERALDEALPWQHLSAGIPDDFFRREYERSLLGRTTPSCLHESCTGCAVCDHKTIQNVLFDSAPAHAPRVSADRRGRYRYRLCYEKRALFRFLGHLELSQIIHRAARRAALPLAFSEGFHPLPRIAFGPPLQLGVESRAEYLDLVLSAPLPPTELRDRLNASLPPALGFLAAEEIPLHSSSIQQSITAHRFLLAAPLGPIEISHAAVRRENGEEFALRDFVIELSSDSDHTEFLLSFRAQQRSPRPLEVAAALTSLEAGEFRLEKTATVFAAVPLG